MGFLRYTAIDRAGDTRRVPNAHTRFAIAYSLTPPVRRLPQEAELGAVFPLGGMQRFADVAGTLLPRIVGLRKLDDGALRGPSSSAPPHARVIALQTPRGDLLVVVEVTFAPDATAAELAGFARYAHLDRDALMIGDHTVAEWVRERLRVTQALKIEYVHQMTFAAGELSERIVTASPPADEAILIMVGRPGVDGGDMRIPSGVQTPPELNVPGVSVLMHNRVMTLAAGWDPVDEHKLLLVALLTVGVFTVMHRARGRAFRAMKYQAQAATTSVAEGRAVLARLGAEMGEVQLDLSFGVEAYVDSVLLPNQLMQNYRERLNVATGVDRAMANTSRMVERLGAVIQARAAVLAAAEQGVRERRDRVTSTTLAIGSTLAIPASLLLTYFGINSSDVDPRSSVLDLGRYWPAYALICLPFLVLLATSMMLRRRIRSQPVDFGANDPDE